jgi:formamidopyrimidine-DNA glycosylase
MPEGPEVTRVTTQLNSIVQYSLLDSITLLSGRYTKKAPDKFFELESALDKGALLIKGVYNKGKFIWWELEHEWFIFSTLGMSGRYSLKQDKHSRILFETTKAYNKYTESISVFYEDIRNFGTIKIVNDRNILNKKLDSIGPDMLNSPCSVCEFLKIARKNNDKSIVKFLMDQKYISGVGNIYKSESLFLAKISPLNYVKDLSDNELKTLYTCIINILTEAYRTGGSTIQTYKDVYGHEGLHSKNSRLLVYNQKTDIYGNNVKKVILDDQRTTYFSPSIQC